MRVSRTAVTQSRALLAGSVHHVSGLRLERLGSEYGGWVVPTALIESGWVCYCGGVGEDVTFDVALIERFGCDVYAFDPTPRAVVHAAQVARDEPRFRFQPLGLWSEDTTLRFYAPRDPAHVSHSVVNPQGTDTYFTAECRTLRTLVNQCGHDRIDLLKIDIEGAEHRVLRSMLESSIRPVVVCTEIDQPVSLRQLWSTLIRLRRGGYRLVAVDGWNLTLVRADALARADRSQ
jgi:FkbM family methyltransferase